MEASFESFLNREGLVAVSKRLEGAAVAFEELFFRIRDRRYVDSSEQVPSNADWKGFLRLSLVTCPIVLFAATSDASLFISATNRTIEISQFIPRSELDPLYVRNSYYLVPDGKVGHGAFAVIRETLRATNKLALARLDLTNGRAAVIALEARDAGMFAMLLRHPREVRDPGAYFKDVQDVHVTKDMLDLAKHIIEQRSGHFDPADFDVAPTKRKAPAYEGSTNVINLMDALRKSAA